MVEGIIFLLVGMALIVHALMRGPENKSEPEEDEHAQMTRPRDKHGRWVKEGDGIITPKGPNANWNKGNNRGK